MLPTVRHVGVSDLHCIEPPEHDCKADVERSSRVHQHRDVHGRVDRFGGVPVEAEENTRGRERETKSTEVVYYPPSSGLSSLQWTILPPVENTLHMHNHTTHTHPLAQPATHPPTHSPSQLPTHPPTRPASYPPSHPHPPTHLPSHPHPLTHPPTYPPSPTPLTVEW